MPPRKSSSSARDPGDWAVPYQPADFTDIDLTTVMWTARAPHLTLEDVVYRHVEAEGPIHRQGAGAARHAADRGSVVGIIPAGAGSSSARAVRPGRGWDYALAGRFSR